VCGHHSILASFFRAVAVASLLGLIVPASSVGQAQIALGGQWSAIYSQLRTFSLASDSATVENLILQRDRVVITFVQGTFYFAAPVAGKVRGAVFIGTGNFHSDVPTDEAERANVRRLLKANDISSDFKTAVFQFTDDTYDFIGKTAKPRSAAPPQAQRLATELLKSLLEEDGLNLASRTMESILDGENPGIFFAQFDGGKRRRFSFLFDPQTRVPVANFEINAGEKGLVFAYDSDIYSNDVWLAFFSKADYESGKATYSDMFNLVDTPKYHLELDLREPKKTMSLVAKMDCTSRIDGLQLIPFSLGEGLATYDAERRKKQLFVQSANLADGTPLEYFQEQWESGFSVALPMALKKGQNVTLEIALRGDFMLNPDNNQGVYFPRSTTSWYPRHGYLSRSTFDVVMVHRKRDKAVTMGALVGDTPAGTKDDIRTEFRLEQPAAFITFAVGDYEIHKDTAKSESGATLPLEFYSLPSDRGAIKEDFILAEMNNAVRYFSALFGDYPYTVFRGVYHPFGYGQGFPTTIMIPKADRADMYTYSFISHETSHQWWGDLVLWRSYRDQWLSEGFADYSGMLYTQKRDKTSSEKDLIKRARDNLKNPPKNLTGIGQGRLVDVGPLIMGHRLSSRETFGAYTALTYEKGSLVLRMLHFLFTDPQTGEGQAFFDMMSEFVREHKNGTASTEQFFALAGELAQKTPLGQKYGYKNLKWFFRQWVVQTYFPSYRLEYHVEDAPGGGAMLVGTVFQDGVPDSEQWFMPLPLVIHLPGGKLARGTIAAYGAKAPVKVNLPQKPEKVELDPDLWVLSDKTSVSKR
jgi:peptidase M1-like protein